MSISDAKIEIEITFRHRLVTALDREGYIEKENGAPTDERARRTSLRQQYAHETNRTSSLWAFFFVLSKDETAPFCLSLWLSSDVPVPSTFKWRPLDIEGASVAGPSKRKIWDGVSWRDNTPPLCYHLSLVDARLRFRALPPPVMRETLLDGRFAEELTAKVASAFDRLRCLKNA